MSEITLKSATQLTVFFDSYCPLCVAEMRQLKKYDADDRITLEDIQADDFGQRFPTLDPADLDARIHGQLADGTLIEGLDVTYLAWKLVGKGWLYAPLRWPVISWFADKVYLAFARNRYTVSFWLTGKKRCADNACDLTR